MKNSIIWIGLDVHAQTIAVAVAGDDGPVEALGTILNRPESIKKLVSKLRKRGRELRACYEAGPCGYVLYRDLTSRGVSCEVIAPSLMPSRPGDRVKTDQRDAKQLAGLLRAGLLTAAWVPDAAHEAFRELIRAREAAVRDQMRSRNRLTKFLLRHGCREPDKTKRWSSRYMLWLKTQRFEHRPSEVVFVDLQREVEHVAERIKRLENEILLAIPELDAKSQAVIAALQALKGVAWLTSATIVAEVGDLTRFASPTQLMSYSGCVPSEHSSGDRVRRGGITKAGNARLRRVLGEAAWQYRSIPNIGAPLRRRQQGLSPEVIEIAWRAQHRLHNRYRTLRARGKDGRKVAVAVARELLGFVWSIGMQVEAEQMQRAA